MSNIIYSALSRQSALEREFEAVANNIANASTSGFRGERHIFSEYVNAIQGEPSLSQTRIGARKIDESPGALIATDGVFDVAIEGDGYFVLETPRGERLTRAGSFLPNEEGVLTALDGAPVQGEGGSLINIPAGARSVVISEDGVISVAGEPIAKLRIVTAKQAELAREGSSRFRAVGELTEAEAQVRQGHIEASNVSTVVELSRLIEIQRAYEIGAQFISQESERIERAIEVIGGRR